jgi:hypothetical protein
MVFYSYICKVIQNKNNYGKENFQRVNMCDNEDRRYDEEAKLEILKEFIKKIYPDSIDIGPESNYDCEIDFWELL